MLLLFLLSTPFYVATFWAILNKYGKGENREPRKIVANFLFVASFIFLGNAIFYEGDKDVYTFIDPLFILSTVLAHPLFYLYFRILTVDPKFIFKKHIWYFVPGILISISYLIGAIYTGFENHKEWLFSADASAALPYTTNRLMDLLCLSSRILFLIQAIGAIWGSVALLKKYGANAQNYYSDLKRTSLKKLYMVNFVMVAIAVVSIVDVILGRESVKSTEIAIISQSLIYTILVFVLGWIGHEQYIVNPNYDGEMEPIQQSIVSGNLSGLLWTSSYDHPLEEEISARLQVLFGEKKIFLNADLTILDVASAVGTNRTYLSSMINKYHSLNFCSFVNSYRYKQAENMICTDPEVAMKDVSDYCGFGSLDSFRRTIQQFSGKSLRDWKLDVLLTNGITIVPGGNLDS